MAIAIQIKYKSGHEVKMEALGIQDAMLTIEEEVINFNEMLPEDCAETEFPAYWALSEVGSVEIIGSGLINKNGEMQ